MIGALGTRAIRAVIPRSVRNWLRDPAQSLEWVVDSVAFAAGREVTLEMSPGWTVKAHPLAARRAYSAQLDDPVQRQELAAFVAACTPGMRLMDVGAHFGVFSLAALHFGGPQARAIAVDPSPTAAGMLATEARLNEVSDRLAIVQACVSDGVGVSAMLDTGVIGAGYFVPAGNGAPRPDVTTVDVVTIDDLCRRLAFVPSHIKIDVEGAEIEAIDGARGVLTGHRPIVFVEIHCQMLREAGRDPYSVVTALQRLEYRCQDITGEPLTAALSRDICRVESRP